MGCGARLPDLTRLCRSHVRAHRAVVGLGELGRVLQRTNDAELVRRVRVGLDQVDEVVVRVVGAPRLAEAQEVQLQVREAWHGRRRIGALVRMRQVRVHGELHASGISDILALRQVAVDVHAENNNKQAASDECTVSSSVR